MDTPRATLSSLKSGFSITTVAVGIYETSFMVFVVVIVAGVILVRNRSEKLESMLRRGSSPWLVEYLGETVSFFRLVGDVNPAVFETFAAFVLEMQRCKKRALLYMIAMVATVPIAPVLGVVALKLGQEVGVSTLPVLLGYTSSLCYGYIHQK
jgi:hypothetical protein